MKKPVAGAGGSDWRRTLPAPLRSRLGLAPRVARIGAARGPLPYGRGSDWRGMLPAPLRSRLGLGLTALCFRDLSTRRRGRRECLALGLAGFAAASFGWLFVITGTLDVSGESLSHTKPFEAFEHLLDALVTAGSNFNHRVPATPSVWITTEPANVTGPPFSSSIPFGDIPPRPTSPERASDKHRGSPESTGSVRDTPDPSEK